VLRRFADKELTAVKEINSFCRIKRNDRSYDVRKVFLMQLYEGWKVGLAGAGVNFLVGVPYSWSIIATGLSEQLGWSPVQAALPYTVFLFIYAFSMVFAGRWQDRAGPRHVVVTGGFMIAAATLLSAFLLTPAGVTIMWGFFYGFGAACCFASVTPAAMKWFPMEKKGMITGVVVLGAGISAFVLAPLINFLVGYGMRNTFLILGILLLTGMTLLARMIKNPPAGPAPVEPVYAERKAELPEEPAWYGIFCCSQYYLLWFMFWVTTGIGVTFVTHLDSIARVQADFDRGYVLVALFAFFNAAGRIVAGLLSDRLGRNRAMTLDFSVTLIALLFLMQAASPLHLGVAISFLGLAYGGLYTLFPAAVAAYFGDKNFGLIYGLVYTGLGFAGVFPLLAGYLYGRQGDFQSTFALLIAACCAVIIVSLIFPKKQFWLKILKKR